MRIYFIWLSGVVAWNFGFPSVPPIADVVVAISLSFMTIGLKKLIK